MDTLNRIKNNFYWLPTILMTISALLKFTAIPQVTSMYAILGLGDNLFYLSIIELSCVIILLFPRTMLVGFILQCCYWSGAIGAALIGHISNVLPMIMLLLFSISFYFKKSDLFTNQITNTK